MDLDVYWRYMKMCKIDDRIIKVKVRKNKHDGLPLYPYCFLKDTPPNRVFSILTVEQSVLMFFPSLSQHG